MKVRAIADGTYGGYYRQGPIFGDTPANSFHGEVFEIDDKPFPLKDIDGNFITETDEFGKSIIDKKTGKPKIKMGTWFNPIWMVTVSDDVQLTADLDPRYDYPPFQIPIQYRERKPTKLGGQSPAGVPGPGGAPAPASVI